MKKIYVVMFIGLSILSSLNSEAQTQKNWFIIGGDIANLNVGLQKNNSTFNFDFTPRIAWFLRDNLAVGLYALAGIGSTKTGTITSTSFNYGIGPVARYYFTGKALESVNKTRWFADANVGINGSNNKTTGQPSVTTNGLGVGFGPGLAYFINRNIALEALVKYNLIVGFGKSTTDNSINFGVGFQIHLPGSKIRSMKEDVK